MLPSHSLVYTVRNILNCNRAQVVHGTYTNFTYREIELLPRFHNLFCSTISISKITLQLISLMWGIIGAPSVLAQVLGGGAGNATDGNVTEGNMTAPGMAGSGVATPPVMTP
jgi:hypothetical protein